MKIQKNSQSVEIESGKESEKEKDRQFVTALSRGLQVLRCFTRTQPALRASEIARMTGLPQPTVWRLCYTLIQEGYLAHTDGGDKLRPNFPVLSLGYAAIADVPLAELAKADMQDIAVRYQGAVSLGVRDGAYMIYVQRCHGSSIVHRDLDVGSRVPLASSLTGWGYIAGLDADEREAVFVELGKLKDERWPLVFKALKKALKDYERTGYVISKGIMHPQISAVSVPILSEDGKVEMALSSGGLSQIFDDATLTSLAAELQRLAARLTPAIHAGR